VNPKKPRAACLNCGKPVNTLVAKYCCCKCQHEFQSPVKDWLSGKKIYAQAAGFIRRYMLKQADYKCRCCGWGEVNQKSGTVPLVLNHIDGDSSNNVLSNLEILCPNCDSLTPTYKGLNKGNGRHTRMERYRNGQSF